jgi:nitroreductase
MTANRAGMIKWPEALSFGCERIGHFSSAKSKKIEIGNGDITMQSIFNRKSIRKYTSQHVSAEQIQQLLKAAMAAPSAGNEQPWEFVVMRDRKLLNEIPKFHPYSLMLYEASVAILVCGDLSREKYAGYWVQDCSAATENMLLEAVELGLGAVWLGMYPNEERVIGMRKLLVIPESVVPFSLVSLGYPAEHEKLHDRFDAARIHYDTW